MDFKTLVEGALNAESIEAMFAHMNRILGENGEVLQGDSVEAAMLRDDIERLGIEAPRHERYSWILTYIALCIDSWNSVDIEDMKDFDGLAGIFYRSAQRDTLDESLVSLQEFFGVDGGYASVHFNDEDEIRWAGASVDSRTDQLADYLRNEVGWLDYDCYGLPDGVVSSVTFKRDFNPLLERDTREAEHRTFFDSMPDELVWTVVDVAGDLYVLPGRHVVNYHSSILTERPWDDSVKDKTFDYQPAH